MRQSCEVRDSGRDEPRLAAGRKNQSVLVVMLESSVFKQVLVPYGWEAYTFGASVQIPC